MIAKQTYKGPDDRVYDWVDVESGSVDEISQTCHDFRVHPLCIETILEGGERPRIQDFDDYSFIILQPLTSTTGDQDFGELYVILSKKWVMTLHKDQLKEI